MPAAAGTRSLRDIAWVAAGGSEERKSLGGSGWAQRTWPQAPVADGKGKGKEAGERRDREVDVILEFGWKREQPFSAGENETIAGSSRPMQIGRAHV